MHRNIWRPLDQLYKSTITLMKHTESIIKSRITDSNLEAVLRIVTSELDPKYNPKRNNRSGTYQI